MATLTGKQKTFCQELIKSGWDRKQAIKNAGYSLANWASIASKLVAKPHVFAEIERLRERVEEKSTVEATEVIKAFREIAFAKPSERISTGDRLRALEGLSRYLCLFSDRTIVQLEALEQVPAQLSDAQIDHLKRFAASYNRNLSTGQPDGEMDYLPIIETTPKAGENHA